MTNSSSTSGEANLAPAPPSESPGWTMRLGEACVLALAVAAFSAVPTALRCKSAGTGLLDGELVGTATLLPVVTLSIVLLRAAGRGLRGVVGQAASARAALGIALWVGLALPALSVLGALLSALTHHRGLGGMTFGLVGLFVVIACALVARRMVEFGQTLVARGVRPLLVAAGGALISVVPLLLVAFPLSRARVGAGAGAGAVGAALLDLTITVLATALVSSFVLGEKQSRFASMLGVPFAAVILIAGSARLESSPALGRAVQEGGGLAATLLSALERWTDRDGDGIGAHFGGADCDEGDPARHPGAVDVPGDGVDQDCQDGDATPIASAAPASSAKAPQPLASAKPLASGASSAAAAPPAAQTLDPAHPDIVLITLDTVRADHTSAYGYEQKTTPHLEELAKKSVLFAHAFSTGSDTQRALMPLVSGKPFSQTPHDKHEWPAISSEVDTVAERMKRAGYATAAVVSFTWLREDNGFTQGFDRFDVAYGEEHPERGVTGPSATRAALSILEELGKKSAPLFLWVHLFDAHEKYIEHAGLKFGRGAQGAYDGEVAFVDKQVGMILAAIEKSSRAGRTAILVHGSHGEGFGEHGSKGHGSDLYNEMIHVPLLLALPDGKAGRFEAQAVSTLDVTPTLLALAGAPSEGVSGVSLLPFARQDPAATRRAPVLSRSSKKAALIDWPLKLIVVERKKQNRTFLFDLSVDPKEAHDLVEERPDDVERLQKALLELDPPK